MLLTNWKSIKLSDMSILLVFVPLILGGILFLFKRYKAALFFTSLSVFDLLFIGTGLFPSILLSRLQNNFAASSSDIHWKNNNLIVLLGGGVIKNPIAHAVEPSIIAYARIYQTAKLYFSCLTQAIQCKIIISGGDPQNNGITEAEAYKNALSHLNVNSDDIVIEVNSKNTYENAEYVTAMIKPEEFDQVVLVTSGIHIKRAMLYFSNFGLTPTPISSDYLSPLIGFIPTAYNFTLTDLAIHEYIGILRFHIYNAFDLNNHDTKK